MKEAAGKMLEEWAKCINKNLTKNQLQTFFIALTVFSAVDALKRVVDCAMKVESLPSHSISVSPYCLP
jgi:hypothetical protein